MKQKPRHLLSSADLSPEEMAYLFDLALRLKRRPPRVLDGEQLALLFAKPSLRTRASFQVGMSAIGGHCFYLSPEEVGVGDRESIADVARVLSRYVDIVAYRTYGQHLVEEFAEHSSIPVINALTDDEHPCQALADLLTLIEKWGSLEGRVLTFVGDGNNVASSLAIAGCSMGMHVRIASPDGYRIPEAIIIAAEERAAATGGSLTLTANPEEGVAGADAVYTDTWISMGQERESERRRVVFGRYTVDDALVAGAKPDAFVMHDLPAHRGEEITHDVFEGARSIIFDQAENRTWAQAAVVLFLLGAANRVQP